jgi:hypothetical protein
MKTLMVILTIGLVSLAFVSSCYCQPVHIDGPYKGRVIDADTRQPIEGVVVLGVWYKEYPSAAGAVSSYYDAEETVTDKNGDFEIKGKGLLILSFVGEMDILIFKAGYAYIGLGPWDSLKNEGWKGYEDSYDPVKNITIHKAIYDQKTMVKWEGDKAIIPLRKLTTEERRKSGPPSRPSIPLRKMKLLTSEINKERLKLKLEPFDLEGDN